MGGSDDDATGCGWRGAVPPVPSAARRAYWKVTGHARSKHALLLPPSLLRLQIFPTKEMVALRALRSETHLRILSDRGFLMVPNTAREDCVCGRGEDLPLSGERRKSSGDFQERLGF